mmetsp:Transcript_56840/g.138351  ORF Transcript_56840/g.138351 Transcript_56840/m.138351 type:complete len:895 (-) Transcript_56840:1759-4443(-)
MQQCYLVPDSELENLDKAGNETQKSRVAGLLERSCRKAGFSLVAGNQYKSHDEMIIHHKLHCSRYKYKKSSRVNEKDKQKQRPSSRPLPVLEQRCPFKFEILQHVQTKKWFFPSTIFGCIEHCGHIELPPDYVKVSRKSVPQKALESILDQLSLHFKPSQIRKLIQTQFGINLRSDQVGQLKKFGQPLAIKNRSPAMALLKRLDEDPTIHYVCHTAELDSANCLTIRNHSTLDFVSLAKDSQQESGTPKKMSPKENFARAVLNALKIQNGQSLLLCCAWVTEQQVAHFKMHPNVITLDVTFGTNSEKRPLARATALSSNAKNLPFFNCFMAAETVWVWDWILSEAMPQLLGSDILSKVQMVLTDQDFKCYSILDSLIQQKVYPAAIHRLCAWHKIDRHFIIKALKFKTCEGNIALVEGTVAFLFMFVEKTETIEELFYMKRQFQAWLDHSNKGIKRPTKECMAFVKEYFTTKFWKDRAKLCQCFFVHKFGGHRITSIPSEQEFARLKGSAFGTRANMNIATSQDAIQMVEEQALNDVERDNWQALNKTYAGDLGCLPETLSIYLNGHCCSQLLQQYEASSLFVCCKENNSTFLVRKKDPPKHSVDPTSKRRCSNLVPILWRTRTVKLVNQKASCSCGYFKNRGIPCRHILAILVFLDVPLTANMCSPRFLKKYGTHYNRNATFTKIVDEALSQLHCGVPIGKDIVIPEAVDTHLAWFREGLEIVVSPATPCYLPRIELTKTPNNPDINEKDIPSSPTMNLVRALDDDFGFDTGPPEDEIDDVPLIRLLSKVPLKRKVRKGPLKGERPAAQLSTLAQMIGNSCKDKNSLDEAYNAMIDIYENLEQQQKNTRQTRGDVGVQVAGFPESEKRKNVKRKRPIGEIERTKGYKESKDKG